MKNKYRKINKLTEEFKEEIKDIRREIHRKPELSCQEYQTSKYIQQKLDQIGIKNKIIGDLKRTERELEESNYEDLELKRPTGVIGKIGSGNEQKKTVILRADIDALPISESKEENHYPSRKGFESVNEGLMHACGHDAHTAMLLGGAKILKEFSNEIDGCIKLLFQPAEEIGVGAKSMISSGVLEDASTIFGMHVFPELESGKIMVNDDYMMAADDMLKMKVKGGGGHGSTPHETMDPIFTAIQIIDQIYKSLDRDFDTREPIVFTITKFSGGNTWNVIPNEVELEGTIRTFDKKVRKKVINEIKDIGDTISELHNQEFRFRTKYLDPPLKNSDDEVMMVRDVGNNLIGKERVVSGPPSLIAEDFAFYLDRIPGVFVFLGTKNQDKGVYEPLHSSRFDVDESILSVGSKMHAGFAIEYLND